MPLIHRIWNSAIYVHGQIRIPATMGVSLVMVSRASYNVLWLIWSSASPNISFIWCTLRNSIAPVIAERKYPNRYSIVWRGGLLSFIVQLVLIYVFNCAIHRRAVCIMNRTNVLHPFGKRSTGFHCACSLHTGPSNAMLLQRHTTHFGALFIASINASDCCCIFRTNANFNCSLARNIKRVARFIFPAAMYRRCNRITASSHLFVFSMVCEMIKGRPKAPR